MSAQRTAVVAGSNLCALARQGKLDQSTGIRVLVLNWLKDVHIHRSWLY